MAEPTVSKRCRRASGCCGYIAVRRGASAGVRRVADGKRPRHRLQRLGTSLLV